MFEIWRNNNVESVLMGQFNNLNEAKRFCCDQIKGYQYAGVGSPTPDSSGSFCYEVYSPSIVVKDEDGNDQFGELVYETGWYYE